MKGEEPPEGERRGLNKGGTWNAGPRQSLNKKWMVPKKGSEGPPGLRMSSRRNAAFTRLLHPQGCARSLQKWLHNNIISIVGICLGVGLLEVT